MDGSTEARIVELETRAAHHERMAEELSAVLAEQGRTIARLSAQLRLLADRLREAEAGWGRSPQDERPPPHY